MEGFFTVTILKGQRRAKDDNGVIYSIHGIEIIREATRNKIFYDTKDPFFRAAAAVGTQSKAYVLRDCSLMLR